MVRCNARGRDASRSATGAPSRSCSPTASRSPRPAACSPTSARPRSTATSSVRSTSPPAWSTTSRASSTTSPRSRSTGRCRDRSRGAHEAATRAGTVHLCDSMDRITAYAADLAQDRIPAHPFVLIGQMNKADPTRSPAGTETVWAYTHVPFRRARRRGREPARHLGRERDRDVRRPHRSRDRGVRTRLPVAGHRPPPAGAARARGAQRQPRRRLARRRHRPRSRSSWCSGRCPGLGRAETPVRGLFLASSSAHPGGGVHGACGANAARAAIAADRVRRLTGRAPRLARSLTCVTRRRASVEGGELAEGAADDGEGGEVEHAAALDVGDQRRGSASTAGAWAANHASTRASGSRCASVSRTTASVSACCDS